MAKEVKVSILVDDNGTMRLTERSAKKLGKNFDKLGKSAQTVDRQLKGTAQASSNSTKNFAKQAQGISGGLVPAYATLAANVFAASAAFQFLKDAGDLRVLQDSQSAFTAATGTGLKTLTGNLQEAANGLLSFQDAAQAASIGVASGLQATQIEELAEGAKNVSQLLGRDVTDSFNRLVRGVTKAEPELLDELGITLRLEDAQSNYATSLRKSAKDLSNYEKRQAVFVEVQTQLEEKYNKVADATNVQANAFAKLGKSFDSLINDIKTGVTVFEPVALFFANNVTSLAAAFGLLAIPIIKSIIPSLDSWAESSQQSAKKAIKAYASSRRELKKLEEAQKTAADPAKAAQSALGNLKTRSTGIQKLQRGDKPNPREINSLLRFAEQGKGAVKDMTKKQKRIYIAALKEMQKANKDFESQFRRTMTSVTDATKRAAVRIKTAWSSAMVGISKASQKAAKVVDRAFRFAGIIGIILLIKDLGMQLAETFGLIREDKALAKFNQDIENVTGKLETANAEFKDFADIQNALAKGQVATREGAAAFGKALDTSLDSILKANKLLRDRDDILKSSREAAGASFADLLDNADSNLLSKIKQNTFQIGQAFKQANEGSQAQANALTAKLQKKVVDFSTFSEAELEAVKTVLKDIGEEAAEANILGKLTQETADLQKTTDEIIAFSEKLIGGLDGTALASSKTGKDFRGLLEVLKSGATLSKEQAEEFERLGGILSDQGNQATFLIQQEKELNSQYQRTINGITKYKTSQSDLIKLFEDQILQEAKLQKAGFEERIANLSDQLILVQKIADLETKSAKEKLQAEVKFLRASRTASPLQKEELKTRQDIQLKNAEILKVQQELEIARSDDIKQDQVKIEFLELQKQKLEEQKQVLEDQLDIAFQLGKAVKDGFESGATKGIADLIKDNESSFKDTFLKIAESALNSVADVLAKNFSKGLTDLLFGNDLTPGEEMAKALKEGAENVKKKIKEGFAESGFVEDPVQIVTDKSNLTTATAAVENESQKGFLQKANEYLFGVKRRGRAVVQDLEGGEVTGETVGEFGKSERFGGIFSNFLNGVKDLFSGDAPFLQSLGNIFTGALGGFGSIFKDLLGGLFGGGDSGAGFLASIFGGFFGAAAGGIMPGGVTGYANGGIVKRPTLGLVGEGKMNEAVVPLPDGKAIPVNMNGNANTNNVTVNVAMDGAGNAEAQTQSDGQNSAELGRLIAGAVQEELKRQKRPGGILSPYGGG